MAPRALDLTMGSDAWGREVYKHSHIEAMFEGWCMARATHQVEGFKLVPVEPTNEMLEAGVHAAVCQRGHNPWCRPCYRAMLAAAPNPLPWARG